MIQLPNRPPTVVFLTVSIPPVVGGVTDVLCLFSALSTYYHHSSCFPGNLHVQNCSGHYYYDPYRTALCHMVVMVTS